MKFNWFTKKSKSPLTVADLTQRLTAARADLATAETAVTAARARLDAERSEAALAELRTARQAAQDVTELVAIVEADLEKAQAAEAASQRAAAEARVAELEATLADRSREQELDQAEVDAWLVVVTARQSRIAHAQSRHRLESELDSLRVRMGIAEPGLPGIRDLPDGIQIGIELMERSRRLPADDPTRQLLFEFGHQLAPNAHLIRRVS